jgi:transcription elongation GreA/GreB family factor
MDKRALIKKFEEQIAQDLAVLTQAALAAHEAATHAESKAEDQYDTRGLEASYLASAESRRAMELQELLDIYRHIDIKPFSTETRIAATALIELECDGKRYWYLLMPKGGGMTAQFEGKTVQTITPQAPIGEAILGKRVGDQIDVQIQHTARVYDILGVS